MVLLFNIFANYSTLEYFLSKFLGFIVNQFNLFKYLILWGSDIITTYIEIAISREKVAKAIAQKSIPEVIVWKGKNSSNRGGKCAGKNKGFPEHCVLEKSTFLKTITVNKLSISSYT